MVNTEIVNSSVTQPGDLEEKKRGPEPSWRVLDNPHGASKIIKSKLSPHRALPPRLHPCSSLSISTRLIQSRGDTQWKFRWGCVVEAFKPWACLRQKSVNSLPRLRQAISFLTLKMFNLFEAHDPENHILFSGTLLYWPNREVVACVKTPCPLRKNRRRGFSDFS